MIVVQFLVFLLGLGIALLILQSAIKQTVLPGRKRVRLTRILFRTTFSLFRLVLVRIHSDSVRDALSAFYAPFHLVSHPETKTPHVET